MRIFPVLLALLGATALAACGGGAGAAAGGTASSSASARSSAATATTQTSPATASVTATSRESTGDTGGADTSSAGVRQSGPPACRSGTLAASFLGQQGATGHGELGFALRNTGPASCRTFGYPGVQFLDRSGGELPTLPTHSTRDFFGLTPLRALVVGPGQAVSFRLEVTHGAGSGAGCTTAYTLQIIAPDDMANLVAPIPGGATECGTTTVSPLRSSGLAYP